MWMDAGAKVATTRRVATRASDSLVTVLTGKGGPVARDRDSNYVSYSASSPAKTVDVCHVE